MTRRPSALLTVVVLAIIANGCYRSDAYLVANPDGTAGRNADAILAVSVSPTTLPADGVSRARITAKIDPAATWRDIVFDTTMGTLWGGGRTVGAPSGPLTMAADSSGTVIVDLQSAAQVGTARITAAVKPPDQAAVVKTIEVPFLVARADSVLTLESSRSSMPADGFSTATITARILGAGDPQQSVAFSTTRGTLVRFSGPGASDATVQADVTGAARIDLRSDVTAGIARVSARALGFTRETSVEFTSVMTSDIIVVRADGDQVPADGATRTRIVAHVSADLPDASRTVTFTTTDGMFGTNQVPGTLNQVATVKADASNTAIVDLRSPLTPVTAGITAAASNWTARTALTFIRALPDTVFVQASAAAVPRAGTNAITVTALLLRNVGQVSDNTVVTFEARDASGTVIGSFSNVTLATPDPSDPSPLKRLKATATFDPADNAALGTMTITAIVGTVSGTVTVQIT
jgi:hypothetical protein